MKCTIIRDLLPLYCDGLTSEDSAAAVEEHLKGCAECTEIYEKMAADGGAVPGADKDIEPLKKVKRRFTRRIFLSIVATAAACGLIIGFFGYGFIPASSKGITWEANLLYTMSHRHHVDENGETDWDDSFKESVPQVQIIVTMSGNGRKKMSDHSDEVVIDGNVREYAYDSEVTFFPALFGDHNVYVRGYAELDGAEKGTKVTIHCRDKDIVLDINELAELCRQNGGHYSSDNK